MMRIEKYFNCDKKKIKKKRFNIFIGISLGNRYFSKENIKKYIIWALENTKSDVLVLVADKIHAINYEILNGYKKQRAMQVAARRGQETIASIKKIINSLPPEKRDLVKIANWEQAQESEYYKKYAPVIIEEFRNNPQFYDFILRILKENLGEKIDSLTIKERERLAEYILDEIPIILNGVEFNGKFYDLHPYPGASLMDVLLVGLKQGEVFPNLAKKLNIEHQIAMIEAYV